MLILIFQEFQANKEEYLLKVTRDNTQFLINHLFELPTENTDVGPVVGYDTFCIDSLGYSS